MVDDSPLSVYLIRYLMGPFPHLTSKEIIPGKVVFVNTSVLVCYNRLMNKKKALNELVDIFVHIPGEMEMVEFLKGILTPQELEEIPVRLQIVKMLKQGIPQH